MASHAVSFESELRRPEPPPDVERFRRLLRGGGPGEHGYAVLLGLKEAGTKALLKVAEGGLPFSALARFQRNLDLPLRELADLVGIPPRTLDRRRDRGRLTPNEADRVLRLSRVFSAALELFEGDMPAARGWMQRRQPALGRRRPLDLVRTETGAREVERLVGRLEHGVFP
jgi:putative toxin-antitoxin system antitoxin component (TIGR02293 family)